jgi:CRISPR-associated protein Cas6
MDHVDLIFQANGSAIPRDHGYALYGAVSRIVPTIHQSKDVGIFPVRGTPARDGTLLLNDRSSLRLRVPVTRLPELLVLVGKALELDGHRLRLGVPHMTAGDRRPP